MLICGFSFLFCLRRGFREQKLPVSLPSGARDPVPIAFFARFCPVYVCVFLRVATTWSLVTGISDSFSFAKLCTCFTLASFPRVPEQLWSLVLPAVNPVVKAARGTFLREKQLPISGRKGSSLFPHESIATVFHKCICVDLFLC